MGIVGGRKVGGSFVGIGRGDGVQPHRTIWPGAPASDLHVDPEEFGRLAAAILGPERAAVALSVHGDERRPTGPRYRAPFGSPRVKPSTLTELPRMLIKGRP